MVRWIALLFACALGLAAPAFAQQRQPAQQRAQADLTTGARAQIVMPANASWQATQIRVSEGATLRIEATGDIAIIPLTQTTAARRNLSTTAAGFDGVPAGSGAPLPDANRAALIGKIGENGAPFLIGAAYRGRVQTEGMVYVMLNVSAEQTRQMQGRLVVNTTATVPQQPPPPLPEFEPRPQPAPTDQPRPVDPTTGAPTPSDPPAPADPPAAQTPNDGTTLAPQPAPTSQAQPTPTPTPAPEIVDPPAPIMSDGVRYTLIGLAVLAGLLIVSLMIRPRGARGGERGNQGAGAQVSARIVSDGIAGQSLTIRTGGR